MQTILHTYAPLRGNDLITAWLGLGLALLAAVATWYFLVKGNSRWKRRENALVAMLFFFVAIIAASTAFFSFWSHRKSGQVRLGATAIQVGSTVMDYTDIKQFYIRDAPANADLKSVLQGTKGSSKYLVIEGAGQQVLLIPEELYPIGEIAAKLKVLSGE